MLKVCRELDFLQEPVGTENRGQLRMENLDRYFPAMPYVFGKEDSCHSTLPELALEAVSIAE